MLNNAIIMGRLTADTEIRTTNAGKEVTSFTVAVDRSFVKDGEDRQADFINVVAWGNTAMFINRYFSKGSMIAIQGRIQTRNYEDKQGNKRTAFEIVASDVSFCGSKNEIGQAPDPLEQVKQKMTEAGIPTTSGDFEMIDDDAELPF